MTKGVYEYMSLKKNFERGSMKKKYGNRGA